MIFVDTGVWYAANVPEDPDHERCRRVLLDAASDLVCDLLWVTHEDVASAWKVFTEFDDKAWSFTDCVSYAVMQRLGIRNALALDEHFRQFGFADVKP